VARARKLDLPDAQNQLRANGDLLVATGSPRFLAQVGDLVAQMADDSDDHAGPARAQRATIAAPAHDRLAPQLDPIEYRVFPLRYAWAEDVRLSSGGSTVTVPGVASILNSLAGRTRRGGVTTTTVTPSGLPGLGGTGLAAQAPSTAANSQLAQVLTAAGRPLARVDAPVVADVDEPISIQADPRLNAVIIRDTRSRLDGYGELIRALDVEPEVIQVEATIIDVDIQRAKQLGVSFSYQNSSGQTQVLLSPGANALTTTPNQGLFVNAVVNNGGSLVARVNALESEGVVRVVSRPLVLTLSDTEAVFSNNQTFYVQVAGSLNVDLFNVTAGTQLKVTPHVLKQDGQTRIRMLVSIDSGSLESQMVGKIPIVENSSVDTEALILEGQSLLVGGMTVQNTQKTNGKIPVLGDLPYLKGLFRSTQASNEHIERLFLITPRLSKVGGPQPAAPGSSEVLGASAQPDRKDAGS
jgi:type III secretion protein C